MKAKAPRLPLPAPQGHSLAPLRTQDANPFVCKERGDLLPAIFFLGFVPTSGNDRWSSSKRLDNRGNDDQARKPFVARGKRRNRRRGVRADSGSSLVCLVVYRPETAFVDVRNGKFKFLGVLDRSRKRFSVLL